MKGRGAFIVFEGVDRCGKTTQTKKLVEALLAKQVNVELARFPDRTTNTGKMYVYRRFFGFFFPLLLLTWSR